MIWFFVAILASAALITLAVIHRGEDEWTVGLTASAVALLFVLAIILNAVVSVFWFGTSEEHLAVSKIEMKSVNLEPTWVVTTPQGTFALEVENTTVEYGEHNELVQYRLTDPSPLWSVFGSIKNGPDYDLVVNKIG